MEVVRLTLPLGPRASFSSQKISFPKADQAIGNFSGFRLLHLFSLKKKKSDVSQTHFPQKNLMYFWAQLDLFPLGGQYDCVHLSRK